MSDTQPRQIRGESLERLRQLERSTVRLATQLESLTVSLEQIAEIRQQTTATHTQAELAVITALDATNEAANLNPQIEELRRRSVTWVDFRRRTYRTIVFGLIGILTLSYFVVTGQNVFSKYCQVPGYLTDARAETCNSIFIGDRLYKPGVQTTDKVYVPKPVLTEGETTNGG